jgi:uncharacterized protein with PhoU and TrkA domain
MCTKQEVQEALRQNSIERDKNLDQKLHDLKVEIFEKMDVTINNRIGHLTSSPKTTEKFSKIDVLCAQRGEQIISMRNDITEIKANVKNILEKIDNGLDKKADKETFTFWRNLLVSGMFLAIFLGVVGLAMSKLLE